MELPECPVCLQPYDEAATVPRVLPCGHSACERCLGLLPSPPAHPNTVRCPACNQLVRFPSPLGPKSLPKNIDLLRFCSPPPDSNPSSRPESDSTASGSKPEPDVQFIPRLWMEDLLQAWKPWILPPESITLIESSGGYLFSSSFDKTVSVWSLQDFSHVRSLKGHEHRVMAMVVMDETQPVCISGDSASGIFVWRIDISFGQELQQKWYEHNDWRYSGIHSLAISGGYLYTGSGDKSIKAWSLQDYSLACTLTGHNSTVSSLVVANGVLYSGSWDGTIRLWCLSDHSLLSVLGDDSADAIVPILSLSVDHHFLVSACENGNIKIWKNDAFVRSVKIQDGAIFAVNMDKKWLFTGGWSKSINIQELSENELQMDIRPAASITCDSIVTSLFSWCGKLFAGFSDKEIKVYYYATK